MLEIKDVIAVIGNDENVSMCLSKGGWEGWLQCELWKYLGNVKKITAEREMPYPYPNSRKKCDLCVGFDQNQWVEIKAFGQFREGDERKFIRNVEKDIDKMKLRPTGSKGLILTIVPASFSDNFRSLLARSNLPFQESNGGIIYIFSLRFE